jgi:hypothetical protein
VPTGVAVDDDFWRKRLNSYSEIRKRFVEALAMSVGRKTGRARAVSIQTLVDEGWDRSQLSGLSAEAMTLLQDLPRARQRQMLESGWKQIASPQLLPLLRQWYEKPPEDDTDLRELALRRLYELAPEEGRSLMMSEMKSPKPRVGIRILSLLPDEMIPELDGFFAEQFNKDGADWLIISGLIERYASPALSSQVRSFYEPKAGKWACSIQSNLLAYLLRVAPDTGMELLSRALQARSKDDTGCWANTLGEVARLHNGPELEKVAVASLDDSDPQIAAQAITLLMSYGSAEAEKPLWERFKQWHDEWNERAGELEDNTRNELQSLPGWRLETAFWQALTRSPGWLADPEKLARVQQLCLTSSAKKEIDAAISKWSGEIPVAFTPGSDRWGYAEVAQYTLNSLEQLKRKLLQFPQKTVFKWQQSDPNLSRDEKENLFRELKSFLEEHGMKLNR